MTNFTSRTVCSWTLLLLWVSALDPAWCMGAESDATRPKPDLAMARWLQIYRQEMAPLRREWNGLVLAIHEGRISHLSALCPDFQRALTEVDRGALATAPDVVVRVNIKGALDLLDGAASQCRRARFFALSLELYKARYLIGVVENRLLDHR